MKPMNSQRVSSVKVVVAKRNFLDYNIFIRIF